MFVNATRGYVVLVSPRDAKHLTRRWSAQEVRRPGQPVRGVYAVNRCADKPALLHRRILPGAEVVDHRNGNGCDCRRSNIRKSSVAKNAFNKRGHFDSVRQKGVFFNKRTGKYFSAIQAHGVRQRLGTFASAQEAAAAYKEAERRVFKDYAMGS